MRSNAFARSASGIEASNVPAPPNLLAT